MSQVLDTGLTGGIKEKGRWLSDIKDGRERSIFLYANEHGEGKEDDQSYVGYYKDVKANKPCDLAVAIKGDEVILQYRKTRGIRSPEGEVVIEKVDASKFMDWLDSLLDSRESPFTIG